MDITCVITGRDAAGKSVFVRREAVKPITLGLLPGYEFHRIWGSETAPSLPSDGTAAVPARYFPPPHGFRFGFFTIPPDAHIRAAQILNPFALAELQQKLPGMLEVMEPAHPGMHTTATVDFDVVVSGECVLELDDGAEVQLKAGDCVVQNGTRHRWHNRSSADCVIAVTLLGAEAKGR